MGKMFERFLSSLSGELPKNMDKEKVEESLEVLRKLKLEHPELDMNFILTGKREDVDIKAKNNFTRCEVNYHDNSSTCNNCEELMYLLKSDNIKKLLNILENSMQNQ